MKPLLEKLNVNSGGELNIIQTAEHLFIGAYQGDLFSGVHLDLTEVKKLATLLDRYIEGVEKNEH